MIHRRHARQARLAEVGEAGQQRLAASTFAVAAPGLAGEVQARYLAGAGAGALVVRHADVAASAREVDGTVRVELSDALAGPEADRAVSDELPFAIDDPAVREIALGAYRALVGIRGVLFAPAVEGAG